MMKLQEIQSELYAPKGQKNSFGNYHYRSCEDIVESVKPILAKHKLALVISDEIVNIGERFYVKATAQLVDDEGKKFQSVGFAREALSKKGMDDAQVTGATSSYARKYALNGLLAIDDTKDADTDHYSNTQTNAPQQRQRAPQKQTGPTPEYLAGVREWLINNGLTEADAVKAVSKPLEQCTAQDFALIQAMV